MLNKKIEIPLYYFFKKNKKKKIYILCFLLIDHYFS